MNYNKIYKENAMDKSSTVLNGEDLINILAEVLKFAGNKECQNHKPDEKCKCTKEEVNSTENRLLALEAREDLIIEDLNLIKEKICQLEELYHKNSECSCNCDCSCDDSEDEEAEEDDDSYEDEDESKIFIGIDTIIDALTGDSEDYSDEDEEDEENEECVKEYLNIHLIKIFKYLNKYFKDTPLVIAFDGSNKFYTGL